MTTQSMSPTRGELIRRHNSKLRDADAIQGENPIDANPINRMFYPPSPSPYQQQQPLPAHPQQNQQININSVQPGVEDQNDHWAEGDPVNNPKDILDVKEGIQTTKTLLYTCILLAALIIAGSGALIFFIVRKQGVGGNQDMYM